MTKHVQILKDYEPIPQPNGVDYKFTTSQPGVYDVQFEEGGSLFEHYFFAEDVHMIALYPETGTEPSPETDLHIGEAVAKVLDLKFKENPRLVLNYICSKKDKQELARARKFNWMFEGQNKEGKYTKITISNQYEYGGFIYLSDNPMGPTIEAAIRNTPL